MLIIEDNIAVTAVVVVLALGGVLVIGAGILGSLFSTWVRASTSIRNYRPKPKRKKRHL